MFSVATDKGEAIIGNKNGFIEIYIIDVTRKSNILNFYVIHPVNYDILKLWLYQQIDVFIVTGFRILRLLVLLMF
jgi:hypothetical protein